MEQLTLILYPLGHHLKQVFSYNADYSHAFQYLPSRYIHLAYIKKFLSVNISQDVLNSWTTKMLLFSLNISLGQRSSRILLTRKSKKILCGNSKRCILIAWSRKVIIKCQIRLYDIIEIVLRVFRLDWHWRIVSDRVPFETFAKFDEQLFVTQRVTPTLPFSSS